MLSKVIVFACLFAVCWAGGEEQFAQVEEYVNEVNPDGSYQYRYRTSNEIAAQESGVGGVVAQGSAQWYAPDGTGVQFSYTADQNGYQPIGTHLPKPHPIPAYILRAIEWAKAHPWHDEWTKPEHLHPSSSS